MKDYIANYILSPCGTSFITNKKDEDERTLISRYANEKSMDDIPEKDRIKLEKIIKKVSDSLKTASLEEVKEKSAELNGIVCFYEDNLKNKNQDHHFILSTDTWLGEQTAELVKSWLDKRGFTVEVYRQKDLQTKNITEFKSALSELTQKLSEVIPGYSQRHYKIVFNLTGGFKSVQGFLQSIANFYADETIYIFERSSQLLRIPKLPIQMKPEAYIEDNITAFRQLALGLTSKLKPGHNIPETLLLEMDGEVSLSSWGELVWNQSKKEIYGKGLLPSPLQKIKYDKAFEKTISNLPKDRKILINEKIDRLAQYFTTGNNLNSLDIKEIKGKEAWPSSHEIDAWSDKDAKRIFAHYSNDKSIFILDKLDKGLH